MKGIDTSKWQGGKVNYAQAKKYGYDFVFLRIGCGSTKDSCFETDYLRAKKAGLKIGIYYYATALTEIEAINDAKRVLLWLSGRPLDMPIAYDMEEKSMKSFKRKDLNSKQYNAFANIIKANGYVPMLYTGSSMFKSYFNKQLITDQLWIASYGINNGKNHGCPNVGTKVAIHQYTSAKINTDFYKEKLDRNQMLISYEELMGKDIEQPNDMVVNQFTPLKGNPSQFAEIIKNLKVALNTDYGLTFTIDSSINNVLLINLSNVVLTVNSGQKNTIYVLQQLLAWWGYNISLDGVYGNDTKYVVSTFQSQVGIAKTGIVAKDFWYKILGK